MNEQPTPQPPPAPFTPPAAPAPDSGETVDLPRLARAVRFAFGCLLLGFAIFSIRASYHIRPFGQIFKDMLGEGPGSDLPTLTVFVLWAQWPLLMLSLVLPLVCFAQLFSRHLIRSIYILGIGALLMVGQAVLLYTALTLPLVQIITRLIGPGGL